jgi:hypothetical protein
MRKKWRLVFIIAGLLILTGISYGLYIWNKPPRDVSDEKSIKITAVAIFDSFTNNEQAANKLYLNKAIEVTGKVTSVQKNQDGKTVVILQSDDPVYGVNCTFKQDPGTIDNNNLITFKGICTGYLSDVIINEGILVK